MVDRSQESAGVPQVAQAVLRLTLITLILYGGEMWYLAVPLRALAGTMLVFPSLIARAGCWYGLVLILIFGNGLNWLTIDNHKYLMTYWTLAVAVALGGGANARAFRVLSSNARWMIGCCFLLALSWKFIGGEYLNGRFMAHTFLLDRRFAVAVSALTGISAAELETNRVLVGMARAFPTSATVVPLAGYERVRSIALFASWWTLLIETIVAVSWLWRPGRWGGVVADVSLCVFVLTTYILAPVVGFASILVLLALAADSPEEQWSRRTKLLVMVFGLVQLSVIPWGSYVLPLLPTSTGE